MLNYDFSPEIALAGSILIDPRCLEEIRSLVSPDLFVHKQARDIFEAACALEDEGKTVDVITIRDRAEAWDQTFAIQAMEITPTAANAKAHCEALLKEASRRELMERLTTALAELTNHHDTASVAADLLTAAEAATKNELEGGTVTSAQAAADLVEAIDRAAMGQNQTVPTGFKRLDSLLGGGLLREGLYILGARPGCGKTTFAVAAAERMLMQGHRVLFISLEMSRDQLMARRTAAEVGKFTATQILTYSFPPEELDGVLGCIRTLSQRPFFFNRRPSLNVQEIQTLAKRNKVDVVIIDYLGLLQHGDGKSLYEKVTNTSNGLKRMARSLGIPVLCLAQLNREVEGRKNDPPRLSDLRDSGAIEQDADGVLLIHKYDNTNIGEYEATPMEVTIAKNRHGPMGRLEFSWYMRNGRILERRM